MTGGQLLTAMEAVGLAFVSFQLGGIFWGIVVHRLGRPATVPGRVQRVPDGRRSVTPHGTGAAPACESTPARAQLGGAKR